MEPQGKLFPDPEKVISVCQSRREPFVWVRRLVVFEKPGAVLRDVRLRRGLNIIWSPDPGAQLADLGLDAGSGHGAGKTLFCRLLRYCLGEDTFANEELRKSIAACLPSGLVAAEVAVAGSNWAIVRSIGLLRRHHAQSDPSVEEIAEGDKASSGMQPFLDSLRAAINQNGVPASIPVRRQHAAWLLGLAFLTRDQECRYDHVLDFRHPRSDSGSVAAGIPKDQLLLGLRSFLKHITAEKLQLRSERERLADEKRSSERDVSYYQRRRDEAYEEVCRLLEFSPSTGVTELAVAALHERAQQRLRQFENQTAVIEEPDEEGADHGRLKQIGNEIAILENQVAKLNATRDLHTEQRKALLGERANLKADEIKALLGPVCPVCNVPIDRALADGCGLSHVFRDPQGIAEAQRDVARQMRSCDEAINECGRQLKHHGKRIAELRAEESELSSKIREAKAAAEKKRQRVQDELFSARRAFDRVADLRRMWNEAAQAETNRISFTEQDEDLNRQIAALREQHGDKIRRLQDLFAYVCQAVLGSEVQATLTLGQALQTSVQVGGMAMESLKAIAFDLAAMLMSVEGQSLLPAFLVHDSPREADLGEAIYHRVFRFVHKLERLAEQPPFQYIITTTTQPPDELRGPPYVVAHLHGSEVEERLLRRRLA